MHAVSEYSTIHTIQDEVCNGNYGCAVYSHPGASDRLSAAVHGGEAANSYDASDSITYIYNGRRQPFVQLGDLVGNLERLAGAASSAHSALHGAQALQYLNATDEAASRALFNPMQPTSLDLAIFDQRDHVLYNTVTVLLPLIQQFFFLTKFGKIANSFGIYTRPRSSHFGIAQLITSIFCTFLSSFGVASYPWTSQENWEVDPGKFVLTWITFWLYMHVNICVFDAATALFPAGV
ncbi:hypothetical protein LSUE1_G004763 [Lachnellula suecica]|uniref:DUF3533 domain-containing protein n=1 Tax=Lachnellula suecica TaxID=602035 RepID=A0A8T9C1C1_9HELO|nr:hypothetical protein LSUE1_G004763 [Lachnellula suecica]